MIKPIIRYIDEGFFGFFVALIVSGLFTLVYFKFFVFLWTSLDSNDKVEILIVGTVLMVTIALRRYAALHRENENLHAQNKFLAEKQRDLEHIVKCERESDTQGNQNGGCSEKPGTGRRINGSKCVKRHGCTTAAKEQQFQTKKETCCGQLEPKGEQNQRKDTCCGQHEPQLEKNVDQGGSCYGKLEPSTEQDREQVRKEDLCCGQHELSNEITDEEIRKECVCCDQKKESLNKSEEQSPRKMHLKERKGRKHQTRAEDVLCGKLDPS